jgi:hypothetical protein
MCHVQIFVLRHKNGSRRQPLIAKSPNNLAFYKVDIRGIIAFPWR